MQGITGLDSSLRLRLGAGLALLQPGIDPIFLVLLSARSGIAPANHGLIVGASQAGMALGALAVALLPRLSLATLRGAAAAGVLACLATVVVDGLAPLLIVRGLFGVATGVLYAATLRAASARDPARAMGLVLFFQLMVATLLAVALPELARLAGPGAALLVLAAVPLANFLLLGTDAAIVPPPVAPRPSARVAIDPAGAAILLFITASAMIWSYAGAQGTTAGLSETTVGAGVALGSLAAGAAALMVARGTPRLPVPLAGLLATLLMAAPCLAPPGITAFLAAMIAFNIGATFATARFSALAIERNDGARARVPALQSIAMVVGPFVAAAAVAGGGFDLLAAAALLMLLAGVAALFLAGNATPILPVTGAQENITPRAIGP